MPGSFWKITALVGVLGLGCLIVLHAQKGMSDASTNSADRFEDLDAAFDDLASDEVTLNSPAADDDSSSTALAVNEPTPAQLDSDDFSNDEHGHFPWQPTTTTSSSNSSDLFAIPPSVESEPVSSLAANVVVHEDDPTELFLEVEAEENGNAHESEIIDAEDVIIAADGLSVDDAAVDSDLLLVANESPTNPFAATPRSSSVPSAGSQSTPTPAENQFLVLPPRSQAPTQSNPEPSLDAPSPAGPALQAMPNEFNSPALLPTPSTSDDAAGRTEPSPVFLNDDVQYFPAGPQTQLPRTRQSHEESRALQEAQHESADPESTTESNGFTLTAGANEVDTPSQGTSVPSSSNPFGSSTSNTPAPGSPTAAPPRTLSFPAAGGGSSSNPFGSSTQSGTGQPGGPSSSSGTSSDPFAPTSPSNTGGTTVVPSTSPSAPATQPASQPSSIPSGSSIPASDPFGSVPSQPGSTGQSSAPPRISLPGRVTLDNPAPATTPSTDAEPTPAITPSNAPGNPFPQTTSPRPIQPSVTTGTAETQSPAPFNTQSGTSSPTTSFPPRTAEVPSTLPNSPFPSGSSIPSNTTLPSAPVNNSFIGDGTVDGIVSSNHQPELQIEKIAPPQAIVGEFLIYEIHVRNVGQSAAHQVVVEDRIPLGSELKGTIPRAELVGTQLLWRLGTIEPGAEQVIRIRVIPTAAGEIGSVATVSFRAEVAATTVVTAPELSVDMTGPAEMAMGEEGAYQFTIRNDGDGEARDVVIVALLPEGLAHPGGRELEYAIGNIAPGEVRTADLVLTAAASGSASPVAQVTIAGHVHDQAELDINLLESRIEVRRQGPIRRFVGRPATYTNVVTNLSSQPLTNVAVIEAIPQGLDLASIPEGGRFDPIQRTITWTIPELVAHESREFRSSVVAAQEGNWEGSLLASDASGNRAQLKTQIDVAGFSSLLVDVEHAGQPVLVGEQVSLRLTIRNGGTAAARNVQATIKVPAELEFVTAQGPVAHSVEGKTVTFEPLEGLDVSGEQSFDIVLTAAARGDARVRVLLNSADLENPLVQEQAVRVFDEN